MEEIQHFAHEHPLTLLRQEERDEKELECFGCRGSILRSDPMYTCKTCFVNEYEFQRFHLHKSCAELPSKAERYTYAPPPPPPPPPPEQHFRASDHGNLTLITKQGYCTLCKSWGRLMYEEKNNGVLFCINCVRFPKTIEHTSHDHPLHLQRRKKSTFTCDACDREETCRSSYHCASCTFWISEQCASLSNSVLHTSHDHPLTLVGLFRLGEEYFTQFTI
ncbi:hypothetical protein Vadar_026713 [Vaccinium darrowii]|uniref:Uncharacterized protein n=1 Tax=Vaccinium darrowii TaxID=229202 RepID=A0ACB7YPP8_9ERIC|nr:hypothetical protein Vadar_026713 [Vaccinium darrowii]